MNRKEGNMGNYNNHNHKKNKKKNKPKTSAQTIARVNRNLAGILAEPIPMPGQNKGKHDNNQPHDNNHKGNKKGKNKNHKGNNNQQNHNQGGNHPQQRQQGGGHQHNNHPQYKTTSGKVITKRMQNVLGDILAQPTHVNQGGNNPRQDRDNRHQRKNNDEREHPRFDNRDNRHHSNGQVHLEDSSDDSVRSMCRLLRDTIDVDVIQSNITATLLDRLVCNSKTVHRLMNFNDDDGEMRRHPDELAILQNPYFLAALDTKHINMIGSIVDSYIDRGVDAIHTGDYFMKIIHGLIIDLTSGRQRFTKNIPMVIHEDVIKVYSSILKRYDVLSPHSVDLLVGMGFSPSQANKLLFAAVTIPVDPSSIVYVNNLLITFASNKDSETKKITKDTIKEIYRIVAPSSFILDKILIRLSSELVDHDDLTEIADEIESEITIAMLELMNNRPLEHTIDLVRGMITYRRSMGIVDANQFDRLRIPDVRSLSEEEYPILTQACQTLIDDNYNNKVWLHRW